MPKLSLHLHTMGLHDPIHEFHYSLSSQEYIPHIFRGMGVGIQAKHQLPILMLAGVRVAH